MQYDEPERHAMTEPPEAGEGTEAGRIAAAAASSWTAIAAALVPIVGLRGVAALYKRSLYLVRPAYPWLEAVHAQGEPLDPVDFSPLQAALSQQTGAEAAAASNALMQTFRALLISLIGPSLTERLLRATGDPTSSAPTPAQDKVP